MLELAAELLPVIRAEGRVAVVTVTDVVRSAPRGVGASLAVTPAGRVIGSISGGCVEGDAVVLAHAVLASGVAGLASFGFSDADARAAGLACGGAVEVIAYVIAASDAVAVAALEQAAAGLAVTVGIIAGGRGSGTVVDASDLDGLVDGVDAVVLSIAPRPRLIVLGAGEHAAALCRVGAAAGFTVTVCDVWELLVTPERFPAATELVVATPHEYLQGLGPGEVDVRTAVCVLTHDERLDVPALREALSLPVGFVGAMGARSTVAHRAARLREAGVSDADLARLHSPLGLDLGGAAPDETAVAAIAEIIAERHGASARPLRALEGPLHRRGTSSHPSCARADADAG